MLPDLLLALEAQPLRSLVSALTRYGQVAGAFFLKCSALLLPRRRLLTCFSAEKLSVRINSLLQIGALGFCAPVWVSGAWLLSKLAHIYAYVSLMIEKRFVLMTLLTGILISV